MSDPRPTALVGRRLGAYEVVAPLGAGGMGEVYRARDTRLGRDVALKVLPAAFTADPERRARFDREARVLAAINHSNIAAIYGVEDLEAGAAALVLELVGGETLAERIRRTGGLPLAETVRFAGQLVDALDAAHEKGIVHRDLKPSNVMVTPDGAVKVLDFGLAKLQPAAAPEDAAGSGAATLTATGEGRIIGTAAYMSPEQARGQAVDKRTDVWAFGCVLYEMLSGRAAFARETVTDILAAVVERDPDWAALPVATPPGVRRLLARCLAKDVRMRLRDIGDARADLREDAALPAPARRPAPGWAVAAAIVGAALGGLGTWALSRRTAVPPPAAATRSTILLPGGQELDTQPAAHPMALSPDGRQLAYVASGGGRTQLYLRALDSFEAKPIAGTEGARFPFFSPDGASLGFFAGGKLRRVSLRGGSPVTICDAALVGRGATWGPDGSIVFDPGITGLLRVSAEGGTPEPLRSRDPAMAEASLSWPHFTSDGRTLLATTLNAQWAQGGSALVALSLASGEWRRLGPGSQAQELSRGRLVFHAETVREGELHAVEFDPDAVALRGQPVAVLDGVFRGQDGGGAFFAVSRDGTLAYAPGSHSRTLVSVDRGGRRTPLLEERRGYRHPALSPDGRQVAVTIDPRPSQVWVHDLARRTGIPLATELHNLSPVWTPDGRRVTFSSGGDLFWRLADASAPAERLLARERAQYPHTWSPDGRFLVFADRKAGANSYDLWVLPLGEEPRPLLESPADENNPRISPDGRWIAYESDESGRYEVYVRPFPEVGGGKWTISSAGGQRPAWSPDGREVFYADASTLMAVAITTRGAELVPGAPAELFDGPFDLPTTSYAVTPDGGRFVMVETDPRARPTQVNLVVGWAEELRRVASPPR